MESIWLLYLHNGLEDLVFPVGIVLAQLGVAPRVSVDHQTLHLGEEWPDASVLPHEDLQVLLPLLLHKLKVLLADMHTNIHCEALWALYIITKYYFKKNTALAYCVLYNYNCPTLCLWIGQKVGVVSPIQTNWIIGFFY